MPQAYTYQQQGLQTLLASSLSIALYTRHPQGDSPGAELIAPGYSRQSITLAAVLNLCAANTNAITWSASGAWATAYYFAICRTADGSMVYWGSLPTPITAATGGTPTIQAGSLLIDWADPAMGMAVNWGALTDRAPVGAPVAVPLINAWASLTSLPSGVVSISTYQIVPANQAAVNLVTVMAEQQLGAYRFCRALDTTRGSTPGYTVAGPTSLAF
jgi:hypothetical protein